MMLFVLTNDSVLVVVTRLRRRSLGVHLSRTCCHNGPMKPATERDDSLVEAAFVRLGIPLTPQRRRVWEHFASCGRACTIAEAAAAVGGDGVAQATVYRTVSLLSEMGLLVRVQTSEPEECYTAIGVGHTHPLVCYRCRKVVEFDGRGDLTFLESHLEMTTGFSIYGHHLEVYGVCPVCSAQARGSEPDGSHERLARDGD